MLEKLKPKSEFSRNVLTLITGTTIAQAIPIAISPILTRIYTPEDFGLFALFIAITTIFGSIANARYELAIMLPKKDEDAINIFALGLIITTTISLILLFLIIFFHKNFTTFLNNESIGTWLYFIPISTFFIGLYNLLNYFNTRKKYYKDIANTTIIKAIITAIIQLGLGFIKQGATGLISGQLISQAFANMRLLKNIFKDTLLLSKISKVKIVALAKRYKKFPQFSLWAILANTLSVQLTNILITAFFSMATLGFYSLVQRLLGMPSAIIGNSIGQVFFQEAVKEKQKKGEIVKIFLTTLRKLFFLGLPLFGVLYFVVEDLFAFVFGEEWRVAGVYAQIVMPLFFVRFLSATLSRTLIVFQKQKSELIINLFLIVTSLTLIVLFKDFIDFLYYFTFFMSLNYLAFLLYYYKLSQGKI